MLIKKILVIYLKKAGERFDFGKNIQQNDSYKFT